MAFQDLVGGGGDCAGGANPLGKFADHVGGGRSGGSNGASSSSSAAAAAALHREFARDEAGPSSQQSRPRDPLVDAFFAERAASYPHHHHPYPNHHGPPPSLLGHRRPPPSFRPFEPATAASSSSNSTLYERGGEPHWAQEFLASPSSSSSSSGPRMAGSPQQLHVANADLEAAYEEAFRPPPLHAHPNHHGPALHDWAGEFMTEPRNFAPVETADFREFEQIYRAPETSSSAGSTVVEELTEEQWAKEFEQLHLGSAEASSSSGPSLASIEEQQEQSWKEYEKLFDAEEMNDELNQASLEELRKIWSDAANEAREDPDYDDLFSKQRFFAPQEYKFERDNPFLEHPSPFEEGIRLLDTSNLSDAALAFEAAVQQDENHAEAWSCLGNCQAENEKELPAIAALQRAVALDPYNLKASLALAVSYTNEGAERQAFECLESWIRLKYGHLRFPEPSGQLPTHESVVDLYLTAVQTKDGENDPDIQAGLGVLFNISGEYTKAVDCFEAALRMSPDDYLLWNRLGATLANGGNSEHAIDAYYEALKRKPSFVRARYNLGVSCINIGCHREAVVHFLTALALHNTGNNQRNVSDNLWDTLKRTLVMMKRSDLIPLADQRNVELFREEFDF